MIGFRYSGVCGLALFAGVAHGWGSAAQSQELGEPLAIIAHTRLAQAPPPPGTAPPQRTPMRRRGVLADYGYAFRPGLVEFSAYGGIGHVWNLTGVNPVAGGSVAVGLSRWAALYGEYSWSRLGSGRGTFTIDATGVDEQVPGEFPRGRLEIPLRNTFDRHDFTGGIQAHLPTGTRFSPYAFVGAGWLKAQANFDLEGERVAVSAGRFAVAFGGGARMYITNRWGVRAEFKGLKAPQTFFGANVPAVIQIGIGPFLQLGR
jgi:opacity protein-like surface antigen